MKGYKQIFAITVFSVFIIPQIAFASWWNPFSWFKKTSPTLQQIEPQSHKDEANQNLSATKLNSNQDKVQQPVPPKNLKPAVSLNKARLENKNSLAQESLKLTNKKIIAIVKPAVVYLETDSGSGSGMIFDSSGFILTNAHVVYGTNQVRAILSDGRNFIGTVIGRDEIKDLAVVQIQANGLSYVAFGNSDSVEQGDQIFTLGYPFGLEGDVSFKEGTISRRVNFNGVSYIEISAEIHPGNSGGPLVDETGKVIGINSLAVGSGSTGALRFAIPINDAKSLIPELENGRTVFKPRMIVPQAPQVPVPVQPPQQPYVPPATFVPTPPVVRAETPIPRFIGDVKSISPNTYSVRFENAHFTALNCPYSDGSPHEWISKAIPSDYPIQVQPIPGTTCTFYLNLNPAPASGSGTYPYYDGKNYIWVGNSSSVLIEAKDSSGNSITKSLSFPALVENPQKPASLPPSPTQPTTPPISQPESKPDTLKIKNDSTIDATGTMKNIEITGVLLRIESNIEASVAPFEKTFTMTLQNGSEILATKDITLRFKNIPKIRDEIASGTRSGNISVPPEYLDVEIPISWTLTPGSGLKITVAGFESLYPKEQTTQGLVFVRLVSIKTNPAINVLMNSPTDLYSYHLY